MARAALVLLGLLAVADFGTASPMGVRGGDAVRGAPLRVVAAVLPIFVGLAAAAVGMSPGGRLALLLLGRARSSRSPPSHRSRSSRRPTTRTAARVVKSRAPLAAGAALSFATAPFAQPYLDGTAHRLASDPSAGRVPRRRVRRSRSSSARSSRRRASSAARCSGSLRYRSFRAPRAAAAALLLAASGGIAAAGLAWF